MAEFKVPVTSTVRMKVPLNMNGGVAQSGEIPAGAKVFTIGGMSAATNLAGASAVFNKFVGVIGGGAYDTVSAAKITTQGVDE